VKINLKGRHFDIIEVIKAELQAVLNTLNEQDFRDAFKNGKAGNGACTLKRAISRVMMASRSKVSYI
jgi:hypothetical protein